MAENLLKQDFTAQNPNQGWVADITYIGTDEGWLYLAVVLDLYSRKVVGGSMSERMSVMLVCDALRMTVFNRKRPRARGDRAQRSGQPILLTRASSLAVRTWTDRQHEREGQLR